MRMAGPKRSGGNKGGIPVGTCPTCAATVPINAMHDRRKVVLALEKAAVAAHKAAAKRKLTNDTLKRCRLPSNEIADKIFCFALFCFIFFCSFICT